MKKSLILASLALALSFPLAGTAEEAAKSPAAGTAEAAAKSPSARGIGPRIERLTQQLNLSDEQKTQVEKIFQEQIEKQRAIHDETQARLKSVLTEEQMAKMDQMRQRGRHRLKGAAKPEKAPE